MNFYDSTLKDVFPELIEHLSLGGVNDVAKVDVILQFPLEGDLDRFGDGHGHFTRGQGKGNGPGVRPKSHALGHTGMGVSTYDDGPFIDRQIIEHLMNHIRHRMIFALGITSGDQAEVVHEIHQLGNIYLGFFVPDRGGVASGLVSSVHRG